MFNRIKDGILRHKKAFGVSVGSLTAVGSSMLPVLSASAEDASEYANLESQMVTSFSTTSSSMLSVIGNILPYVLVIVGAVLVITIGIRLFKRFGKG